MSIHKKTRKQKIIADHRRKLFVLENKNLPFTTTLSPAVVSTNNVNSYSSVFHDIRKTGMLILFIIAAQVILLLLLKNHIIKLPFISY